MLGEIIAKARPWFADLQVPDTWASLEDFARWYLDAGMPMAPPHDFKINITDNAYSLCLFRKPPYQVELYLIKGNSEVWTHEHPYVEVQTMLLTGGKPTDYGAGATGLCEGWGAIERKMTAGMTHGTDEPHPDMLPGGALLSFERWPDGVRPSTVAAVWKGRTVGPLQEALIRQHFPDAYIKDGYADITRTASEQ